MGWAYKCGVQGLDYLAERDGAALSGSLAHAMIESHIKDGIAIIVAEDFLATLGDKKYKKLPKEYIDNALRESMVAFESYLAWRDTTALDIIAQEMHLVSSRYRYGGTPDAIGLVDDEDGLCLLDWKTSKDIYPEYLIQCIAYKQLWEEEHPDQPIESVRICRFDKTKAKFEVMRFRSDFGRLWESFELMLRLYDTIRLPEQRIRRRKKEMRDVV
ncbi:MAG: hypothetical protein JRE40_14655 [Deltaproteobacteria bacterium]|nr:hypothetical protein [Deltaproteobacteria bacterium]